MIYSKGPLKHATIKIMPYCLQEWILAVHALSRWERDRQDVEFMKVGMYRSMSRDMEGMRGSRSMEDG